MIIKDVKNKLESCNIWDDVFIRFKVETATNTKAINIIAELCIRRKDGSIELVFIERYS